MKIIIFGYFYYLILLNHYNISSYFPILIKKAFEKIKSSGYIEYQMEKQLMHRAFPSVKLTQIVPL